MADEYNPERVDISLQWPAGIGRSSVPANQMMILPGALGKDGSPDDVYYLVFGHAIPPIATDDATLAQLRDGSVVVGIDVRAELVLSKTRLRELRSMIDTYLRGDDEDGQS